MKLTHIGPTFYGKAWKSLENVVLCLILKVSFISQRRQKTKFKVPQKIVTKHTVSHLYSYYIWCDVFITSSDADLQRVSHVRKDMMGLR